MLKGYLLPVREVTVFDGWTDEAILEELGDRLRRERLNRNLTRENLAERAGVSVKTIHNLEVGEGPSLTTVIRVMRGLGLVDRLDALVPKPSLSPIELLKLEGNQRQRASGS